jgi:hypothetical protein
MSWLATIGSWLATIAFWYVVLVVGAVIFLALVAGLTLLMSKIEGAP